MDKENTSLYMQIIKAESNAAVIRDVVVAGMDPFLCRMIKAFVGNDLLAWSTKKIFLVDLELYKNNPTKHHLPTAIFTFDKLVSYLSPPLKRLQNMSEEKLKGLTYNDIKQELLNKQLVFNELDFKDLDTAAIIKILNGRLEFDHDSEKLLWDPLDTLSELRNKFEGHLTENLKLECTAETVKNKISLLVEKFESVATAFQNKAASSNSLAATALSTCYQQLLEAATYLSDIKAAIDDISGCEILKDSRKYTSTNLLRYTIFAVYPNLKSDKFRRFCNDEFRTQHALKGKKFYTDTGTISLLESYSLSKNEEIKGEAKRLLKELFEPLLRVNVLKVIKLDENDENDDYIDLNTPKDEERFINLIQQINGNICVITDNAYIAKKVWELNANKDMKSFSAVAVKVYNKSSVIPFYE